MIGSFNETPIAAADHISHRLGRLITRSATQLDEIKARKAALRGALLLVFGRSTPNGRECYASLVAKEMYEILEELVTIPTKAGIPLVAP